MKNKRPTETPFEKEVKRLHARGKTADIIAIRLGVKMSKILPLLVSPA